jgi:hypothetical protein
MRLKTIQKRPRLRKGTRVPALSRMHVQYEGRTICFKLDEVVLNDLLVPPVRRFCFEGMYRLMRDDVEVTYSVVQHAGQFHSCTRAKYTTFGEHETVFAGKRRTNSRGYHVRCPLSGCLSMRKVTVYAQRKYLL